MPSPVVLARETTSSRLYQRRAATVLHVGVALLQEFFGYSKVWASPVFSCCLNKSDRFKSRFCCLKPNSVCLIRSFARIPFIRFFDRCGDNSISSSLMRKICTFSLRSEPFLQGRWLTCDIQFSLAVRSASLPAGDTPIRIWFMGTTDTFPGRTSKLFGTFRWVQCSASGAKASYEEDRVKLQQLR